MEHAGLPSTSISLHNEEQWEGALGSSDREVHTLLVTGAANVVAGLESTAAALA